MTKITEYLGFYDSENKPKGEHLNIPETLMTLLNSVDIINEKISDGWSNSFQLTEIGKLASRISDLMGRVAELEKLKLKSTTCIYCGGSGESAPNIIGSTIPSKCFHCQGVGRVAELTFFDKDGLTYQEIYIACKNIGINLDCVGCSTLFFTGHYEPHDENCTQKNQTQVEVEQEVVNKESTQD